MNEVLNNLTKPRKVIHIDMDCFFAAIEIRDNPTLRNKPVAVGGTPAQLSGEFYLRVAMKRESMDYILPWCAAWRVKKIAS